MSDRKYGHRGYMDSDDGRGRDRDRGGQGPKSPRGERPPGPRGRGLGKPTATVFRCAVCGEKQLAGTQIDLDSQCWKCNADLHTCTHCKHFDSSAPGQCRERPTQLISAKAKRNTCELFQARSTQEFAADAGADTPSDARAAFDALFKL